MLRFVRRRFSLLLFAFAAVVCTALGARARSILNRESPLPVRASATTSDDDVGDATWTARDKSGAAVAERNMFCADCQRPGPTPAPAAEAPPPEALDAELIATHVARPGGRSFATIRSATSGRVGTYAPGDALPGAGIIDSVARGHVMIRQGQGDLARLDFSTTANARPVAPRPTRQTPRQTAALAPSPFAESVRRTDDGNYEIDRAMVEKVIANPAMARGVRAMPTSNGVALHRVSSSSPAAALGLESGDVIAAANGLDLGSPDKLLEAFGKLRQASNISLDVLRSGQKVTLNYALR